LLQRFHPGQRRADPGIGLAAGQQFQQLIGRAGEVDLLDLQIAFGEKPCVSATATPTLQTAFVFQVILSSRGDEPGATALTSAATWQIGGCVTVFVSQD
jgi:hypothetical protein